MDSEKEMICDNCGKICEEWTMFHINTGRRTQHICPKCYLKGQSDTGLLLGERRAVSVKIRKYKK